MHSIDIIVMTIKYIIWWNPLDSDTFSYKVS